MLTNLPDRAAATGLARILIEERIAACANVLAPCFSVYRWQGKIECTEEVPLLIKTRASFYPLVEQRIREHHPYELPEIVGVSLVAGFQAYLDWVVAETSPE